MNVLIVDDESDQRDGIASVLKKNFEHTRCLMVPGYNKAVAALNDKNTDIDIILLDIELNDSDGHNGIDIGRYIRTQPRFEYTPILFITGYAEEAAHAIHVTNCFDFLVKPFRSNELVESVQKLIDRKIITEKPVRFRDVAGVYFRLLPSEIVCMKSVRRNINVFTISGEFTSNSMSLTELMDALPDSFIRCHKSYIINSQYIANYDSSNALIRLRNYPDGSIPIGRTYRAPVDDLLGVQNMIC